MNALDEILRNADGAKVINDWLGDGGNTVGYAMAIKRGEVCVSCPLNAKGDWTELYKFVLSDAIKRVFELKRDAKLKTELDYKLGICRACSCVIGLKIWVPFEHIRAHTSDQQLNELPSNCWQFQESRHA